MKIKKMICGLAALVTMFSACVVPASAIRFETSETPGCPSFLEEYDFHVPETNIYLVYENEWQGIYYSCHDFYDYVLVTADETTNMQNLYDLFGDEHNYLNDYLDENQHAFTYIEDFDYESLYAIDGVENVKLASSVVNQAFYHSTDFFPFDEEDGIDYRNFIEIIFDTSPETVLTKEMFADTGYNVAYVSKLSETDDSAKWAVYYEKTSEIASPVDFTEKAKQIEGIISADMNVLYLEASSLDTLLDLTEVADLIGDANGDGIVNIADLIIMKNYLLENVSADMLNLSKSDLNNDGDLSAFDYISIKKKMIK